MINGTDEVFKFGLGLVLLQGGQLTSLQVTTGEGPFSKEALLSRHKNHFDIEERDGCLIYRRKEDKSKA